MVPVLVIFGLVVIESWIYPNQSLITAGFFHPVLLGGGLSFRLPDILVPVALAARLFGSRRPLRLQAAAIWWLAFLAWLTAAAVVGIENGNSAQLAFFEAKAVVYIGFFLLVAGVPAAEFVHSRAFRRFLYGAGAMAAAGILLNQLHLNLSLALPGLEIGGLGPMGADAATIFLALGLIAAAIAVCSEQGRAPLFIASLPLVFASLVAQQRAALLAMAVALVLFAAALALGWKRVRSTPTEIFLGASSFALLLLIPVLATAVFQPRNQTVPFLGTVNAAFDTQAKRLSAQDRLNQWRTARHLIAASPIIGSGLGFTYQYWDPGFKVFVTSNLTHNIGLDLLMRVGAIGLGLFLIAVLITLFDGLIAWLKQPDPLVASFALACFCALAGLLAKGMVESIFEKYRLTVLLGFLVGGLAATTLRETARAQAHENESTRAMRERPAWN
jgi:hypothetical protein